MVKEKRKRKKWYPILSSQEFNNAKIGETLLEDPQRLIGKKITINLMTLTNDYKKQNTNVVFKIMEVKDNAGICNLVGYKMSKSHARRVVRKIANKIDSSFKIKSKDNVTYVIKLIIVTRYKCNNSVLTSIQKRAQEYIFNQFKDLESKDVFTRVMAHTIQYELKKALKKIYPIGVTEIRVLERTSK